MGTLAAMAAPLPDQQQQWDDTKAWAEEEMRCMDRLRLLHSGFPAVLRELQIAAQAVIGALEELVNVRGYDTYEAVEIVYDDLKRRLPKPIKRINK